jgi:hypothetical protein
MEACGEFTGALESTGPHPIRPANHIAGCRVSQSKNIRAAYPIHSMRICRIDLLHALGAMILSSSLNWQRNTEGRSAFSYNAAAPVLNCAAVAVNNLSHDPEPESVSLRFVALERIKELLPH